MSSRRGAKISLATAIILMVGSIIAFVLTLVLGAFVFDKYNAYGEVPIPGTAKLHLPAGQVTVNFHTVTVGNSSGGGLPVPRLGLDIDPPAGVPNPKVTESDGTSTSVNNDIHRRVWIADISTEGDYVITTDGQVNGFIDPRLAFGHDSGSSFRSVGGDLRRPVLHRAGQHDTGLGAADPRPNGRSRSRGRWRPRRQ